MNRDPEDDGTAVEAFTNFMTFLAPPPRGARNRETFAGEFVFFKIGCAGCHVPVLETGHDKNPLFDRVKFFPFSDFLLQDMGRLGDGIEQNGAGGKRGLFQPFKP